MERVKNKLRQTIDSINNKTSDKKTLNFKMMECICLYYMMEISDKGKFSSLPISDMYDIINIYRKDDKKDKNLYLNLHYEKTIKIKQIYYDMANKYKNLKWLINHSINLKGQNKDFTVRGSVKLIAYNDDYVIICYIRPQFNSLNFSCTLYQSILDTYIIHNIDNDGSTNPNIFINKKVISCIFTLDKNEPYYIDWVDGDNNCLINKNKDLIKNMVRNSLIASFSSKNKEMFRFFKYWNKIFETKTPKDTISSIINEYTKDNIIDKNNSPQYIYEFLLNIKSQVKNEKDQDQETQQRKILNNYNVEEYFLDEINKTTIESVDGYLI
jgi:hypothetical protein